MIEIDKKIFKYNIKEVHFSKNPYDIDNCDYLIFPYCPNKVEMNGFTRYKKYTSVIDLTQNLDTIWKKMNRNTIRNIKQAEKEDIKIRKNCEYDKFYQIYRNFLQKKGLTSVFEVFGVGPISLESLKKNGTLFIAELDDKILAGHIFIHDDAHIEDWVTGSIRLDNEKDWSKLVACGNRLILWETIKYAKEKGIKEFDLGGLFPEEKTEKDPIKKGINTFKLSFGGDLVPGYTYEKGYSTLLKFAYQFHNLQNRRHPM
jgi:lipid II:glycine glycyltransferase (peptidoglycan interpeptide bridge formation enzyme)